MYYGDIIPIVKFKNNSIFTKNYEPNYFWDSGCQIVCLNYQLIDDHVDTYLSKFKNDSFVSKPTILQGATIKEKVTIQETELSKEEQEEIKQQRKIRVKYLGSILKNDKAVRYEQAIFTKELLQLPPENRLKKLHELPTIKTFKAEHNHSSNIRKWLERPISFNNKIENFYFFG